MCAVRHATCCRHSSSAEWVRTPGEVVVAHGGNRHHCSSGASLFLL
jgi:hypothetical protein